MEDYVEMSNNNLPIHNFLLEYHLIRVLEVLEI